MPVPGAVADVAVLSTATVKIPTPGGDLDAYMACPTGAGSHPGIIVIHEAFGLVEHTRDLARRFANLGMCALAPDLYCRVGPPNLDDMGSVFSTMLSLHDNEVVADLEACAVYLRGLH